MKMSSRRIVKALAILTFVIVVALSCIFSFIYYSRTAVNAAYISSNYDKIKIPAVFHLEKKNVSDAVPDDSSLPAQGNYTYGLDGGADPLQSLKLLHDELVQEGFNSTEIKTYRLNGSLLYVFNATNEELYLDCRILLDTPESTVPTTDSDKLTVFATHNTKD
jgi:hypothetical protein